MDRERIPGSWLDRYCIRQCGDYVLSMRLWLRFLMILAWLAYGLMPALAGEGCRSFAAPDMVVAAHGAHMAGSKQAGETSHMGTKPVAPCDHCQGMMHVATCSGCIVTLPADPGARFAAGPYRYPAPALDTVPLPLGLAPPTPPPRV